MPKPPADLLAPLSNLLASPRVLAVRLAGGAAALDVESKRELLRKVRAHEEVVELEVEIRATRDPVKPRPLPYSLRRLANANYTRFVEDEYEEFGSSFRNGLFLRDHSRRLVDQGGRIMASSAAVEKVRGRNEWVMRQTLHLVEPWAVAGVLSGSLDQFSIGWGPKEGGLAGYERSMICTVCDSSWIGGECLHWPGDVVKLDSGERVVAEIEWRDVVGREVSAVTFPAVMGTGIDSVEQLAALAEMRGIGDQNFRAALARLGGEPPDHTEEKSMKRVFKVLGLSADAAEESVLAAVEELERQKKEGADRTAAAELELRAEREAHERTRAQLAAHEQREAAAAAMALDVAVDKLYADGRLVKAQLGTGRAQSDPFESTLREIHSKLGSTAFEAAAARLPAKVPVGRQTSAEDPQPRTNVIDLSARQKKLINQMGMSEEQYLKNLERGGLV